MQTNPVIDFTNVKYVFLDRDGVLNRKPAPGRYITRAQDLVLLPGVEQAIAMLNRSKRRVIVVTNQRGIALGLYSQEDLMRIHEKLRDQLAARGAHLDAIYVCPHDHGQCDCRKPLTGLFNQAFRDYPDAQAGSCVMVGDSLRDIEAGLRARMPTVLIDAERSDSKEHLRATSLATLCASSLLELVQRYISPHLAT